MKAKKFAVALLSTSVLLGNTILIKPVFAAQGAAAFYNTHWTMKGPTGIAFDILLYSDGTYYLNDFGGQINDWGKWSYSDGNLILDGETYVKTSDIDDELATYSYDIKGGGYVYLMGKNVDKSVSSKPNNNSSKSGNEISVYAYGEKINWTDGKPYIDENGRTLVPLRDVADGIGRIVSWNPNTKTATFSGNIFYYEPLGQTHCEAKVEFKAGSKNVVITYKSIDSKPKTVKKTIKMDSALVIKDGRAYAPIRYLANAFALDAEWNQENREITLVSKEFNSPF